MTHMASWLWPCPSFAASLCWDILWSPLPEPSPVPSTQISASLFVLYILPRPLLFSPQGLAAPPRTPTRTNSEPAPSVSMSPSPRPSGTWFLAQLRLPWSVMLVAFNAWPFRAFLTVRMNELLISVPHGSWHTPASRSEHSSLGWPEDEGWSLWRAHQGWYWEGSFRV